MNGFLVDTNVISEILRPATDQLYISVVNIAEIRFGIELQEGPARRAEVSATGENTKSPFTSAFKPHSIIGDAKIML
jgi:predicted nucleic acid-binding protein